MNTCFKQSSCRLYSKIAFGGRFKTRRKVSRIRFVVAKLSAVRFHSETISSYKYIFVYGYKKKKTWGHTKKAAGELQIIKINITVRHRSQFNNIQNEIKRNATESYWLQLNKVKLSPDSAKVKCRKSDQKTKTIQSNVKKVHLRARKLIKSFNYKKKFSLIIEEMKN